MGPCNCEQDCKITVFNLNHDSNVFYSCNLFYSCNWCNYIPCDHNSVIVY